MKQLRVNGSPKNGPSKNRQRKNRLRSDEQRSNGQRSNGQRRNRLRSNGERGNGSLDDESLFSLLGSYGFQLDADADAFRQRKRAVPTLANQGPTLVKRQREKRILLYVITVVFGLLSGFGFGITSLETTKQDRISTVDPYAVRKSNLTKVGGITVHKRVAVGLKGLLNEAEAAGLPLSGSGYRASAKQIELRRAHCGPSESDIFEKPASQCSPPTARPGTSLHEQGRAVDFTYEGKLLKADMDAYTWLRKNGRRFGLYRPLPEEPWHWEYLSPEAVPTTKQPVGVIGRLIIPRMGKDLKVVEGATAENLKKGPAHRRTTAGFGEEGNAVVACHRTAFGAPCFTLDQLVVGDSIFVQTNSETLEYQVKTEWVFPVKGCLHEQLRNIPKTGTTPNKRTLTIFTHHPPYTAQKCLVIRAQLVPKTP
jgi:LPXTG-site transpeptidase (sortase) family protein